METPLDAMEPYQLFKQTLESELTPLSVSRMLLTFSQRCIPHSHNSTPSYTACLAQKNNKSFNLPSNKQPRSNRLSNKHLLAMLPLQRRLMAVPKGCLVNPGWLSYRLSLPAARFSLIIVVQKDRSSAVDTLELSKIMSKVDNDGSVRHLEMPCSTRYSCATTKETNGCII